MKNENKENTQYLQSLPSDKVADIAVQSFGIILNGKGKISGKQFVKAIRKFLNIHLITSPYTRKGFKIIKEAVIKHIEEIEVIDGLSRIRYTKDKN
jgi:hypothetical protein